MTITNLELHTQAIDYLTSKFNIKFAVNCRYFDLNPEMLVNKLAQFQGKEFAINDKILLLHMDTDYYDPLLPCGTIPINVVRIFKNLNISLSCLIFVTNHFGISKEFNFLLADHHLNDRPLIIETLMSPGLLNEKFKAFEPISVDQIEKSAVCMMGQERSHRVAIYNFLIDHSLLDKIAVSQHFNA